jgi:hypothetical protein
MPGGSMPVGPPGLEVGSREGGPVSRDPSSARQVNLQGGIG